MKIFFWFCLATILCGLLVRIPFAGGGILLSDVLVPIFAGLYLGHKLITGQKIMAPSFFIPGFVFILWALATWLLGAWDLGIKEKILSASYLVRLFSILVLGVAAADYWSQDQRFSSRFWPRLWGLGLGVMVLGFLQFYLIPDIGNYSTEGGFDPHIGRFLGTWMDPNFVGGFLAFLLPILIGQIYKDWENQASLNPAFSEGNLPRSPALPLSRSIPKILLALIFVYALFLTFSRSGYLAAGLGLGIFFLFRDPRVIVLGIFVAVVGIFSSERALKRVTELGGTFSAVIFQNTDEVDATASLRVESWARSWELFTKYPVFGIGYNTYRFRAAEEGVVDENYFSAGGSDSTLLTILVTTGFFGLLLFLCFYARVGIWFLWDFYQTKNPQSLGFVSGFAALLVHSVFVNSFLFPHIFMVVVVLAGVLAGRRKF